MNLETWYTFYRRSKMLLLKFIFALVLGWNIVKRFFITRYGACTDCDFYGKNYQRCNLGEHKWDSWSTQKSLSTKNQKCRKNFECDFHSQSGRYVCRNEDGYSEECSIGDYATPQVRAYRDVGGGENTWDLHLDGVITPIAEPQVNDGRGNEMVELHSKVQRLRNRRRLITSFYRENPNSNNIRLATGDTRSDTHTVLYKWQNNRGSDRPSIGGTTEIRWKSIRLDIQGTTHTANLGDFMNWQLQINGNTNRPSSVAHANIPKTLRGFSDANGNDRGWRRMLVTALHHSLNAGATVWVVQEIVDCGGVPQIPRRGKRGNIIYPLIKFLHSDTLPQFNKALETLE